MSSSYTMASLSKPLAFPQYPYSNVYNDTYSSLPIRRQQPLKINQKQSAFRSEPLIIAGLLIMTALLTRTLPTRSPVAERYLLPTDWKTYFRIGAGILAVNQINTAFSLHLRPWMNAVEAVAVINPLAAGFSLASLSQMLVMAPLIAGSVESITALNKMTAKPLKEKYGIPEALTKLVLSLTSGALGIWLFPKVYKQIAQTGIFGKMVKQETSMLGSMGALAACCARGCSPGSLICLSETAELIAGFFQGLKQKPKPVQYHV
jgi:hypothetical protein